MEVPNTALPITVPKRHGEMRNSYFRNRTEAIPPFTSTRHRAQRVAFLSLAPSERERERERERESEEGREMKRQSGSSKKRKKEKKVENRNNWHPLKL
jgi:hypothetical protein